MAAIRELKSTQTLGWRGFMCALVASFALCSVATAQAPAASGDAPPPAATPEQLEKLVGPIALFPDDLVALILPASTSPLQLVQADRFLEKRKADPKLAIDDNWDDAVKSLLNYPEVVKKMSGDLDWTVDLGEAVIADQGAVLDAIQAFRRRSQSAGNLKTDDKQVITVEKEIVKIVPANPEVIYVPQYNPATVVVTSSVPVYGYYAAPYPSYYYPYAPGAAMAAGVIWGAAIGAAWSGNRYGWGGGNDININRNTNISTGGNTINRGGANASQRPAGGNGAWKSDKKPGQVSGSAGRTPNQGRVGDAGGGRGGNSQLGGGGGRGGDGQFGGGDRGAGAGGARPSTQPAGGGGRDSFGGGDRGGGAGGARASTQPAGGGGRDFGGGGGGGNSAFGGYGSGSGRQTQMDSSRGAASRSSMSGSSASRGSMASSGASRGGGAGASRGGGGGARAGGGGRGGRR